jgi:heme oxygenase
MSSDEGTPCVTARPQPASPSVAAAPTLAERLKAATAVLHRRVEGSAFMVGVLRGRIDRAAYVGFLHNLQALYAALEQVLPRHAGQAAIGPVVMPQLFRSASISADLKALGATVASAPLAPATQAYVARLHELDTTRPGLLVAHAYVRYLGDLNGGQALRRVVARTLGLSGPVGTVFYDFGDAATRRALVQRFRDGLNAVGQHSTEHDALVAEAVLAFERHGRLFDELAPGD